MSEKSIIRHCSPTLAGIKTANLFACEYNSRQELLHEIRKFNKSVSHKGIVMVPVKTENRRALIYTYRPTRLSADLKHKLAEKILLENGYESKQIGKCIARLMQRLSGNCDFPHEIGLFLGYPPEDVEGFIRNNGCNFKFVGLWKVYGDEVKAQKCFANYKKCTQIYSEQYEKGKTIERLTVAV